MLAVNGPENQSGATEPPQHFFFPARVQPGGFIPPLFHGENDLNFGASGLGFIPDIAAVTPEDLLG
jgi:hypothetical protein